jgi:hypothetical protein
VQAAGADDEDLRLGDFLLPLAAHFGQQDVPAVSGNLLVCEFHGRRYVR